MALPSMISSLSQNAPVPSYVCEDVVGKQQLTIDVLYAMIKQEITHSCGDYLNDGEDEDCISEKQLTSNDQRVVAVNSSQPRTKNRLLTGVTA